MKSMFELIFALALALSLTFGAFSGVGTASAASNQPAAADGINPIGSKPTDMGYCYPSGYNRQGWRCGLRLAMAPYNLGSYNYYYNNGYYYNYSYGYYPYNNYNNGNVDYGGQPRYNPYYYGYGYNYNDQYGCYCR